MRREIIGMTAVVISAVVLAVTYSNDIPQTNSAELEALPEREEEKKRNLPHVSVGRMMQSLQHQTDWMDYGMAVAYIRGVDAGMWGAIDCYVGITEETNEQLAMAWVWFALQNPEVWQLNMAVAGLTYGMLKQSFPCKTEEEDGQGSGDPEAPAPTGGSGSDDQ